MGRMGQRVPYGPHGTKGAAWGRMGQRVPHGAKGAAWDKGCCSVDLVRIYKNK